MKYGPIRPVAESTCGFGLVDPLCGNPADYHVWLEGDTGALACSEHIGYIEQNAHSLIDVHPFGGVCNVPGTNWQPSQNGEPGFCFFDLTTDAVAEVRELVGEPA